MFYGLAAIYARKSPPPDMARGDEASLIDLDAVERQLYLFSPIVLRGFMVCNTLRAWGMNRES